MSHHLSVAGCALGIVLAINGRASFAGAEPGCGEWVQVDPPAGTTNAVLEVEARSATDAFALSWTSGLVRWDGASWSQFPISDVLGDYSNVGLRAIDLVGPSHLFLSGQGITGPFSSDVILKTWNGTSWSDWHSVTLQPNIQGAPRNGTATAVVGVTPDDLWIVGNASGAGSGNGALPLTVHWDGSQLTEVMTPGPGDTQNNVDDAVAITSDDVWAVGSSFNTFEPPFGFFPVTYHWDGSSWSSIPVPAEVFDGPILYAVTAVASDDVWAAGADGNQPLFLHWNGTDWAVVPAPATTGTIQQIAAIASDDVWAVDFAAQVPVISKYYHWDGVAWSIVTPPVIPGATTVNRHGGLAAVGECDVWAVGSIDFGSGIDPFIERLQAGGGVTAAPTLSSNGALLEVSPNPVQSTARIRFAIPGSAPNRAHIYNVHGRRVRTLFEESIAGEVFSWDGRDDAGGRVPGGVYFLRVESNDGTVFTEKLTVVR